MGQGVEGVGGAFEEGVAGAFGVGEWVDGVVELAFEDSGEADEVVESFLRDAALAGGVGGLPDDPGGAEDDGGDEEEHHGGGEAMATDPHAGALEGSGGTRGDGASGEVAAEVVAKGVYRVVAGCLIAWGLDGFEEDGFEVAGEGGDEGRRGGAAGFGYGVEVF